MNNSIRFAAIAICAALMVSGCDFIRAIAGRPTSEEVGRMRAEKTAVAQQEAARKAAADSLAAALKADSEAQDAFLSEGRTIRKASELGRPLAAPLGSAYYFIIGSYSQKANAERAAAELGAHGYGAELIPYGNGLTAVGAAPSASLGELYKAYAGLKGETFFPKDAWILANE